MTVRKGEQSLWASVLWQVVSDLTHPAEAEAARRWIGARPGRDFTEVCYMAGLDPIACHEGIRDHLLSLPPLELRRRIHHIAQTAAGGLVANRQPRRSPYKRCSFCGTPLSRNSISGVCRQHNHLSGHCRCSLCTVKSQGDAPCIA